MTEHPVGGVGVSLLAPDGTVAVRTMDVEGHLLDLALGLGAHALTYLEEPPAVALARRLRRQAVALASSGPVQLALPPEAIPGAPVVEVRLRRSAVGPLATVRRARDAKLPLGKAAPALLACAADGAPGRRLGVALAVEGILGWFALGDQSVRSPQQAVAYSLIYATERLEQAAAAVPEEIAAARGRHRLLTPHAGG